MGKILIPGSDSQLQTKNSERMEQWTRQCNAEGFQSLCLVSIGYGMKQGQIDVKVPAGITMEDLKEILTAVIASMPKQASEEIKGLQTLNEAIKRNFH